MKFPKSLPNDVVLRTWMAHRKNNDSALDSIVSPVLQDGARTDGVHPHVVTLSLRPFGTTNMPVDSFIASHSPRRSNTGKQKFMLKPLSLDQKNFSPGIHTNFGKEALDMSVASSFREQKTIPHGKSDIRADRPYSNDISQNRVNRPSASVVNCSDFDTSLSTKQYAMPDRLYTLRNNSFRPPPRISHITGQKITFGHAFASGFNYHTGYINLLQTQTDLVATGTPVSTIGPKQIHAAKPASRWPIGKGFFNEKGCKYPDPMIGCCPSFQARMSEITQHELDTMKWEKGRKGKKKSSSG